MDPTRITDGNASAEPARAFIVSGHAPERQALQEMLEDEGLAVLGATGSVPDALTAIPRLLPDLAIVDTLLREYLWIAVCRKIWNESPTVRCLTLGSLGGVVELRGSVLAGARGHAVRTLGGGDLIRRVRAVAAGEDLIDPRTRQAVLEDFGLRPSGSSQLVPEERGVLFLCASGFSDREGASEMGLDELEFQELLRSALAKLGYAAAPARNLERPYQ